MKKTLIALAVVSTALTLNACNKPDRDRTVSVPGGVASAETVQTAPAGYSAPPAQPDMSPPGPNANHAAPGTDPNVTFADKPNFKDPSPQPERGGMAADEHRAVMAQDAANKAPDTASADEAKKAVMSGDSGQREGAGSSQSKDESTRTTNDQPRHGTLSKGEESTQMPKEGQANSHSSTDLEKDSGRPSR